MSNLESRCQAPDQAFELVNSGLLSLELFQAECPDVSELINQLSPEAKSRLAALLLSLLLALSVGVGTSNTVSAQDAFGRQFLPHCEQISDQIAKNRCYSQATKPPKSSTTTPDWSDEFTGLTNSIDGLLLGLLASIYTVLIEVCGPMLAVGVVLWMLLNLFKT